MMALFNAREHTLGEWKALLTQADARFVLEEVVEPRGSALALMDVR
jgi:hypothetical protein